MAEQTLNPQQRMNQLALEANYLRSMAEELQRRLLALQGAAEEHRAAIASLGALPAQPKDAFLPVGGGAYLKGRVGEGQKVLVETGARVLLETPREHAIKLLETRERDIQHESERIAEQLQETARRLEELGQTAQALRAQAAGAAPLKPAQPKPRAPKRQDVA